MTIFVSIASYRDPELIPTIHDCLAKAKQPDGLRFGICWQHGDNEDISPLLRDDPRFRILDVDWRHSKGVGWARSKIMGMWNGESYFLQIDSHHRFVQDWDAKLIKYAALTASPKPILSTYCPMYCPTDQHVRSLEPTQMDFDYFTNDGIPMFKPAYIPNWQTLQRPLRARFISAHFLFAPGSFVQEVPYNPDIYFQGEEITLSVRAYTCGYDLFHPPEALLWHEYSRENRSKHWDDHVEAADVELPWHRRDAKSREQVCDFLTASRAGMYGCGSVRTVAQYQAYAGISFSHKKVQDYTLRGAEPPNPTADANWAEAIQTWCVRIEFERNRLPAVAFADAQFWYVGLHDSTGAEIYRNDLSGDKLIGLTSGNSEHILFEREFQSSRTPVSWTVWPFSHSGGWLDKIDGPASLRYSESI